MSLLQSLLLGKEGSYHIFGMDVRFQKELPAHLTPPQIPKVGLISQCAQLCINSHVFRLITQGYTHVFVHEMSHALASKLITKQNAKINLITSSCAGVTFLPNPKHLSNWQQTIISAAGSMGDIAFSTCSFATATAFKNTLSWPIALAVQSGAVMWISGELLYAYGSACQKDDGDFGQIAKQGNRYLAAASVALVAQCALVIFAALR